MLTLTSVDLEKNQYFYLGISEDESSKIIFLASFQLVTQLNTQNRNETGL